MDRRNIEYLTGPEQHRLVEHAKWVNFPTDLLVATVAAQPLPYLEILRVVNFMRKYARFRLDGRRPSMVESDVPYLEKWYRYPRNARVRKVKVRREA